MLLKMADGRYRRSDGPTLLVASAGGHLQQLWSMLPRFSLTSDVIWATPRSGLSESLLNGQAQFELPYTKPRDWQGALHLTAIAYSMLKRSGARRIISTGASPAPPFFLAGAALGLELHYIESATRSEGPSLSGALIERIPSAHLYTQYPEWANSRWHYAGSIFDPYRPGCTRSGRQAPQRVVVTLGTEAFDFRRAVERLLRVLPSDAEILWQTGHTDVRGLGIESRATVPAEELRAAIAAADVVISHAGTGSALTAFELAKAPLLLPREARFGEHVDDHQQLTARELSRRGLAVAVPVDELTEEYIHRAAQIQILRDPQERPFTLQTTMARRHLIDLRMPHPRTTDVAVESRSTALASGARD